MSSVTLPADVVPPPRPMLRRRLRRERLALWSGAVIALVLLLAFAGAPLAARLLGHGPNDLFDDGFTSARKPRRDPGRTSPTCMGIITTC
jgi:hypothetical protein